MTEYDWEAAALCGSNQDPSLVRFARKCMDAGKPRWKPIETAPKDGSYFLGAKAGSQPSIWIWDSQPYHQKPRPFFKRIGPWGDGDNRANQPTHWMPLPEPPTP